MGVEFSATGLDELVGGEREEKRAQRLGTGQSWMREAPARAMGKVQPDRWEGKAAEGGL